MRNILTQPCVTHVLLIDSESEPQIEELTGNCVSLHQHFRDAFYEATRELISQVYRVVLVLREGRTDVLGLTSGIEAEMKAAEISFSVNKVAEEDMFMWKGKVGLLCCSLWTVAGALLLNDVPIPPTAAEPILDLANRLRHGSEHLALRRSGWFGTDFHVGLLARDSSVGYLLIKRRAIHQLRPGHTLKDILRAMASNCQPGEVHISDW